ncbi:uncharacterized protein TRUGW13939_01224 [Talaromyces rugulosus]|uniref:FAD-binding domain-containing protein n=1 Tax=Talaromyces rugulosus TaxID=121627 RepID=A0A7H8QJM6_TALRU|nr:uncharacterized protein TRUGW13939_01224 [Talaromyces rugulosus]QKX54140.1 hypothetical protein TRUGW13939_01224 [Talaromyces rugulosus]
MAHREDSKFYKFDNGSDVVLDIGIVGAGIAGLTAAATLSRLGHHVDVYERSSFANEIGAAINVGPNAMHVLRAFDFDVVRARFLKVQEGLQVNGHTLETTHSLTYEDYERKFHVPWYFSHRVDLHNELKRLALNGSDGFPGAKLHLAKPLVDVDCENGVLKFEDGSIVRKDVIVGADGVHSVVAQCVLGAEIPASAVGEGAFRFLIPTEKLLKNPITKPLFQDEKVTSHIAAVSDRRIVYYPCRNGEVQNFVGLHPVQVDRKEEEIEIRKDWQAGGSIQDLLDTFAEFHPALVEVCRNAEDLKLWKLFSRAPISKWTKGKVIIVGDAVHPMLPHQGQAGNQAIEDAGALGVCLSDIRRREDIPLRLELVQNIRRERAAAMQIFSNAGQDQSERIQKEAQLYVKGPIPKNRTEFHQWNFAYDVLTESVEALAAITSSEPGIPS